MKRRLSLILFIQLFLVNIVHANSNKTITFMNVEHVSYSIESYSLTKNQKFESIEVIDYFGNKNSLKISASGFKNNVSNVDWIAKTLYSKFGVKWSSEAMIVSYYRGYGKPLYPEELEFAMIGTLSFNYGKYRYTCPNMPFGIGYISFGTGNAWAFINNTEHYKLYNPGGTVDYTIFDCNRNKDGKIESKQFAIYGVANNVEPPAPSRVDLEYMFEIQRLEDYDN